MIQAKLEITGITPFELAEHDNPLEAEHICDRKISTKSDTKSEKYECPPFSIDSSWLMEKKEISHCQIHRFDCDCFKVKFTPLNYIVVSDDNSPLISDKYLLSSSQRCELYNEDILNICNKDYACEFSDTEILPCIQNIFKYDFEHGYLLWDQSLDPFSSVGDCQCTKPCEVPPSPSVVDATVERSITDEGEVFSSGDELDKFESDTDSQDTVIEGEAYKRIRSVAIKEKILHANEELFGSNGPECLLNTQITNMITTDVRSETDQIVKLSLFGTLSEVSPELFSESEFKTNVQESPTYSDAEESDSLIIISSHEKHFLSFTEQSLLEYHSLPPLKSNLVDDKLQNRNEMHTVSSYYSPFAESVCSSESSDNGSDAEEVILSDISTSSDEATYIVPAAGFQYYSQSIPYKLHTIAEESCEESERSFRNSSLSSKIQCESELFDKPKLSFKNIKEIHHICKPPNSNVLGSNFDHKVGKGLSVYAALATSRLEKYFQSCLLRDNTISYPDDDMTDESGEVSSDEDTVSNRSKNSVQAERTYVKKYRTQKLTFMDRYLSSETYNNFENSCPLKKHHSTTKLSQQLESRPHFDYDKSDVLSKYKPHTGEFDFKPIEVYEHVSDEEAKYIMNHLMQHISNNSPAENENFELEGMSPMLKVLESEIARLMLTVSPASLSAGEPSSSCSSTIGSNNSDYGSDTLESAEDSTSEEDVNPEIVPDLQPIADISSHMDSISSQNEAPHTSLAPTVDFMPTTDPVISEETLYICKQLMASLKKIADSTEVKRVSDEIYSSTEDHSAKQYIADQIVSLMQTVNASHNSSPLFRTNCSPLIQMDSDPSDSDSPPNGEKRGHSPSESGSETTISASISIPSYDDSDRTPTESEISHEMDELYALLESSSTSQDIIVTSKFSHDLDNHCLDKSVQLFQADAPLDEHNLNFSFAEPYGTDPIFSETECSLLYEAACKLENLLPISIEERIARYKDAFLNKEADSKEQEFKSTETRINVILPQPSILDNTADNLEICNSLPLNLDSVFKIKSEKKLPVIKSCDNILSSCSAQKSKETLYNVTSVKIISHNTYPPSSAIHKILSNNIDSTYLDQKHDYKVSICDSSVDKIMTEEIQDNFTSDINIANQHVDNKSIILSTKSNIMNPKEKASSENDLFIANYRTKFKSNKVFGTKSVGNICELETMNIKSAFRDTGYYSFKSSGDSFLSLDDSTASQISTASLTQYRSLTSTETIPEEEESSVKGTCSTKMSLSSSNIPDAVCDTSASKSSTLPLSLRNKLCGTSNTNHRTRSSFFSTSGVLRKLTLLRGVKISSGRVYPPPFVNGGG